MPLVYRCNVPEKPRSPKAPSRREWHPQDGIDRRPRTLVQPAATV
jgi:hypothetical protein